MSNGEMETGVPEEEREWKVPEEPETKGEEKEKNVAARPTAEDIKKKSEGFLRTKEVSPGSYEEDIDELKSWSKGFGDHARREKFYSGWTEEDLRGLLKSLGEWTKEDEEAEKNAQEYEERVREGERKGRIFRGEEQSPRPADEDFHKEIALLRRLKEESHDQYMAEINSILRIVDTSRPEERYYNYPGWTLEDFSKLVKLLELKTPAERRAESQEYNRRETQPPTEADLQSKVTEFLSLKERDPRKYQSGVEELRYWILDGGSRQQGTISYLEGGWSVEDAKKLLKQLKEKGPSLGERIRKRIGI